MSLLTRAEQNLQQLGVMARVFARANRTISGVSMSVSIADTHGAPPAWSNDTQIVFNMARIGTIMSLEDMVALYGLNYHELSHIMYTPGSQSLMARELRSAINATREPLKSKLRIAFNILEDQRIETLFTQRFAISADYFQGTFVRYCLSPRADLTSIFPLAWGRRYLPHDVRKGLAKAYCDQPRIRTIKKLIDEYRLLVFGGPDEAAKVDRAMAIVRKFAQVLPTNAGEQDPFQHRLEQEPVTERRSQESEPAEDQEVDAEWAAEETEEQDKEEARQERKERKEAKAQEAEDDEASPADDDDEPQGGASAPTDGGGESESESDADSGEGEGNDADTEGSEAESQNGSPGVGADGDDDDSADGGDEEGDGEGGGGSGVSVGTRSEKGKAEAEVQEALEQAMGDLLSQDSTISSEVKESMDVARRGDGKHTSIVDHFNYGASVPGATITLAAKKVAQEFSRLAVDADPGFLLRRSSGRLNIQRVMQGVELDEAFDQWDQGVNDATDIDLAVACDVSGSMMGAPVQLAAEVVWAIKIAVESIRHDITVPVYLFDDTSRLVGNYASRAEWSKCVYFPAYGSTDPLDAIDDMRGYFAASRKKHKVALFVTDGMWANAYSCDTRISALQAAGVVVVVAYVGPVPSHLTPETLVKSHGHGADVFTVVDPAQMGSIVTMTKGVVAALMTKKEG